MTGRRWIWMALPALALAALLAVILIGQPLARLSASAPPLSEPSVQPVALTPAPLPPPFPPACPPPAPVAAARPCRPRTAHGCQPCSSGH